MRPKSMVLILIALGCGLIASIGISQVVEKGNGGDEPKVETAPVFVAKVNVTQKEVLTAQSVGLEEWPIDRIPPGAVTRLEDIEGRKPRQPLFQGEVILAARLLDPNHKTFSADRIPPGYRVVPIRVTIDSASMGLLTPGDTVDIIVLLKEAGGTAKTILSDITVFAIGDQIERTTDEEGVTTHAKTVSLVVTPADAEKLLLGAHLGEIKLSLRSTDDDKKDVPSGASSADLRESNQFGMSSVRPGQNDMMQLFNSMKSGPPVAPSHEFEMQVMSATGNVQKFTWTDRNELPNELNQATGPSRGTAATTSPFSDPPAESSTPTSADDGDEGVATDDTVSISDNVQPTADELFD